MNAIAEAVSVAKFPDPISDALALTKGGDAGAIFEHNVLELLRMVRQTNPAKWARVRAEAKEAKVSISELDRLTTPPSAEGSGGSETFFRDVEPWHEEVDGNALLTDIVHAISMFVIAEAPTIRAAALWSMHTYAMDIWGVSPLANITAETLRAGKTIALTTIERLCYRPLSVSNISTSTLFRCIESFAPTLLIDECDSFLSENEEARGILNAGLYRDSARVLRCVGDEHEPKVFSVWAAKALCGIGKRAETLTDRSIPLKMRRKLPSEKVQNLRRSDPAMWESIRRRIVRWVDDHRTELAEHVPEPHAGLHDRANDCWEPLFVIADVMGGDWSARTRADALFLHSDEAESPGVVSELLEDLQQIFAKRFASRLATSTIIEELIADDEAPWATWNRGRPITPRQLSSKLSGFGIRPRDLRGLGGKTCIKGYELSDMQDALERYVLADKARASASARQASPDAGSSEIASATGDSGDAARIPRKASPYAVCRGDADTEVEL